MNTPGIWSEKVRLGGKPCIRRHRFSMASLLAELADRSELNEIVDNFDLDPSMVKLAMTDLASELCLHKINSKHIIYDQVNCVRDTNIPVSWLLENLRGSRIKEVAKTCNLEEEKIINVLWDLAALLNQDWTEGPPKNLLEGST